MATQSLSLTTILKTATDLSSGGAGWQTMTTGAGNGSVLPFQSANFIVIRNDTVSSATITIKAAQPSIFSQRSVTVPDHEITVGADEIKILPVSSAYSSNGQITVESDEAVKIMAIRKPTID